MRKQLLLLLFSLFAVAGFARTVTGTVTVVGGIYSGAPVPLFAAGATYDVLAPDAGVTVTGVVVVARLCRSLHLCAALGAKSLAVDVSAAILTIHKFLLSAVDRKTFLLTDNAVGDTFIFAQFAQKINYYFIIFITFFAISTIFNSYLTSDVIIL